MMERQSYRLSRLICLTKSSSYSVCSTLREAKFSYLVAECKEILIGMEKVLESMTIEDSEPELEVIDKPESRSEVVAELVSPKEEILHSPQKLKSSLLIPL